MKKRIGSLLLILAMCFAMLPTAAFAVDDEGSTICVKFFLVPVRAYFALAGTFSFVPLCWQIELADERVVVYSKILSILIL